MPAWPRLPALLVDDLKPAAAEPKLAVLRCCLVLLNLGTYFLFLRGPHDVPWLVGVTAGVSLVYAFGVLLLEPHRRWPAAATATAWATAVADGVLIALWVYATGGAHSPYYLLWFASLVAVSFRFGFWESVLSAVAYAVTYVGIAVVRADAVDPAVVGLRCAYVLLVGVAAGLNGQYSWVAAKARLDMGERMLAAQQAEARIRDLLGAVPDPILIADLQGRVVLANDSAVRAFGSAGQMHGDAVLASFARGEDRTRLVRAIERAQGAPQTEEVVLDEGAGSMPVEVRLNRFDTADGPRLVAVLRDLTERRRAEEERLGHVERLKEFERLKELESFRTQFINAAAHELGTPLTPIRMQVHLLRKHDAKLPPEQRRSLDILERNVTRLGGLVQEILDSARIQANRLGVDRRPMDVNAVVLEAVESFHEAAAQANVRLSAQLGAEMRVMGDEKRLTQVLFNLLGNALKFTPAGGEIVVETRRQRDAVLVSIRDTGIGIRAEDQKRLFQPFAQINAAGSPKVGAGLGLYISRGLIDLHGGRLWCESPGPGLGSTFHFLLPTEETIPLLLPETPKPKREESPLKRRLRDLV